MQPDALNLVDEWHRLLNEGDVDALVMLVHPDVEVGGPRGASHGVQVVREWFGRAGVQLIPVRVFRRGNTVVMGEHATWNVQAQPGSEPPAGRTVWTVFTVADGLITSIMRFDDLASALTRAGLAESDEVT
jgi:hypothetical protein